MISAPERQSFPGRRPRTRATPSAGGFFPLLFSYLIVTVVVAIKPLLCGLELHGTGACIRPVTQESIALTANIDKCEKKDS
jgi:hypothetical protein